jgi:hypothetical protein
MQNVKPTDHWLRSTGFFVLWATMDPRNANGQAQSAIREININNNEYMQLQTALKQCRRYWTLFVGSLFISVFISLVGTITV